MDTDNRAFYSRRGYGLTMGYGQRPAVLVVDLIQAFTDQSSPLGADLSGELAATRALLDAARAAGQPVYYTTIAYDQEDLEDAGLWRRKIGTLDRLMAGAPGPLVDASLGRRDDEPVVVKKYASAFFGTDLHSRLTTRGIDTLLLAGTTTSGCVRASVVDAMQCGIRPMIVEEAVGDRSPAAHEQSLVDMEAKYGDVVSLESATTYLESCRAAVAAPAPVAR